MGTKETLRKLAAREAKVRKAAKEAAKRLKEKSTNETTKARQR